MWCSRKASPKKKQKNTGCIGQKSALPENELTRQFSIKKLSNLLDQLSFIKQMKFKYISY